MIYTISKNMPGSFNRYFEPFLGGGAVLFNMLVFSRSPCYISDLNEELIRTYLAIRDDVDAVIATLQNHAQAYSQDPTKHYYKTRANTPDDDIRRASRLIFLNRVCFNGLYRVNSKGEFNVPLGSYANPSIVNEDNLRTVSSLLRSRDVQISCADFEKACEPMKEGDFVYFDPPYYSELRTSFTSYNDSKFDVKELERLVDLCYRLDGRGCHVMLSNSDLHKVASSFDCWNVKRVGVNRSINSSGSGRTGHSELLITNYPTDMNIVQTTLQ